MTSFGTLVENIRAMLQTELGVEFLSGVLNGRQAREIGCVWGAGKTRGDPATDEVIEIHVRIFMGYDESVGTVENPWDPTLLYAYSDALQAAVKLHQKNVGAWFISWEAVEIDWEDQGLEAVIVGRQTNLAETYA